MGTKKGRIYGKEAPQRFGGGSCPNFSPLDPPLLIKHLQNRNQTLNELKCVLFLIVDYDSCFFCLSPPSS